MTNLIKQYRIELEKANRKFQQAQNEVTTSKKFKQALNGLKVMAVQNHVIGIIQDRIETEKHRNYSEVLYRTLKNK